MLGLRERLAAMHPCNCGDDGQSEAMVILALLTGRIDAIEALEQPGKVLPGDRCANVLHGNGNEIRR